MLTQVVLAFAWRSLNEKQKAEVEMVWRKYPRGRYLIPYEWARILRTEIPLKISEPEEREMLFTWNDHCKKTNMDQMSIPFDHDEWFTWLAYAEKHYSKPLPIASPSSGDWAA